MQRTMPGEVRSAKNQGTAGDKGTTAAGLPELRERIPSGVEGWEPAEILQRRVPDRMVAGVSQGKPAGSGTTERVPDVHRAAEGVGWKILQPVLLSAGNGPNACGGNMRLVRREVYGHQRAGAAVLQPKMRSIEAIHPERGASWEAADQRGQCRGMEGETDTGGTSQQVRETRETGMAGVRDDQYVQIPSFSIRI